MVLIYIYSCKYEFKRVWDQPCWSYVVRSLGVCAVRGKWCFPTERYVARCTTLPAVLSDPPTGPINIALLDRCIIQMSAETAQKYSSGFVRKAGSECGFITDCRCLLYRIHNCTALQIVFILLHTWAYNLQLYSFTNCIHNYYTSVNSFLVHEITTYNFTALQMLFIISTRRLILS